MQSSHRKLLGLATIVGAGLVAFVAWAFIHAEPPFAAGIALDNKLSELRQRGEPLTTEPMARQFPDPHPDDDARAILQTVLSFPRRYALTEIPLRPPPSLL